MAIPQQRSMNPAPSNDPWYTRFNNWWAQGAAQNDRRSTEFGQRVQRAVDSAVPWSGPHQNRQYTTPTTNVPRVPDNVRSPLDRAGGVGGPMSYQSPGMKGFGVPPVPAGGQSPLNSQMGGMSYQSPGMQQGGPLANYFMQSNPMQDAANVSIGDVRRDIGFRLRSQAFDQRMAAQDQRADQRYAAHDMNRSFNPLQWSTAGSGQQYAGQQAQALGYQPGVGINPALAAQSNFAADFNTGAGGAIGAGMAQRFGPRSPLGSPAGQPGGTYDMQVGGYGSPVEYRQINPQTIGSPLRSREQQMLATGDRLGADEVRRVNAAKTEAQKVRQAAYRAANGGVSDAMRGRIRQQETKEQRDLQQAGVNPLSAEASVIAPTLYQRAQQARANPTAAPRSPLGNVFDSSAPATAATRQAAEVYDSSLLNGVTDDKGNVIQAPSALFASMGFATTEEMSVPNVHGRLSERVRNGQEMEPTDLRELHQYAASRKHAASGTGQDPFSEGWGVLERNQGTLSKLWKQLAALPPDAPEASLRQWEQRYRKFLTMEQKYEQPMPADEIDLEWGDLGQLKNWIPMYNYAEQQYLQNR